MSSVWLWVTSEWRRRIGSLVGLALLIGVAGGATLAAWAGARRTASSYDRRLAHEHSANIDVLSFPPVVGPGPEILETVVAIPGVTGAMSAEFSFMRLDDERLEYFAPIMTGLAGREQWNPELVRGRSPDPNQAGEVAINEVMARDLGVDVGSQRFIETLDAPSLDRVRFDPDVTPAGPTVPVTVVGIYRTAEDISDRPEPSMFPSAALIRDFGDQFTHCRCRVAVRTKADRVDEVTQRLRELFGPDVIISQNDNAAARIDNPIGVQTAALYSFMLAAALAGLAIIVQAMLRHSSSMADESTARAAIGMTREQLLAGEVLTVAPAIAVGVLISVVAAVAASPLLPLGVARRAEPDPGVRIDLLVLGLGAFAILLVTIASAAGASWWLRRFRAHHVRPLVARHISRAAMLAGSAGPSVRIGVGMAVDRRSGGMAARSAMGGVAIAVAGVLGSFGLVHAIDRVLDTPEAYGANYDALVEATPGSDLLSDAEYYDASAGRLVDNPAIESVALMRRPASGDNIVIGPSGTEKSLNPNAYENRKGSIPLTIIGGSAPTSADEVAIGEGALKLLDADVGDYVEIVAGDQPLRFHVVGSVLYPAVDDLDQTVVLSSDGLALIDAAAGVPGETDGIVIRFGRGVDQNAALAEVRKDFPTIERPQVPSAVLNLDEIGPLPYYLAAFLGLLGAAAMAHALVMTARRRRRDLAVCRAIGFLPRQVVGALGTHAVATTFVGLVFGIPFGFALGRQVFTLVVRRAHVLADFPVPFGLTLLVAPAAIVVALAIAVAPAAVAARVSPADILRAE